MLFYAEFMIVHDNVEINKVELKLEVLLPLTRMRDYEMVVCPCRSS